MEKEEDRKDKKNGLLSNIIAHQDERDHADSRFKDVWLNEMLRDRSDLGVVAWMKTHGDCGNLNRLMTCKEIARFSSDYIHWKTIGRILIDLRILRAKVRSKNGWQYNMEDFRSKVTLTSLPRYTLSDLKSGKPIDSQQWSANFDATYKDSVKRWKLDYLSHQHDGATKAFRERYNLSFADHLKMYHYIIDRSVLHPAPPHMHGHCLLYKGGEADEADYCYISSKQYKAKANPDQPELHTPMAHRLVALVHYAEIDFGKKGQDRNVDCHHTCMVPSCVNPDHLLPLAPAQHKEWHKDISNDLVHPMLINPIGGDVFPSVIPTTPITAAKKTQIEMFPNVSVSLANGRSVLTSIMVPPASARRNISVTAAAASYAGKPLSPRDRDLTSHYIFNISTSVH